MSVQKCVRRLSAWIAVAAVVLFVLAIFGGSVLAEAPKPNVQIWVGPVVAGSAELPVKVLVVGDNGPVAKQKLSVEGPQLVKIDGETNETGGFTTAVKFTAPITKTGAFTGSVAIDKNVFGFEYVVNPAVVAKVNVQAVDVVAGQPITLKGSVSDQFDNPVAGTPLTVTVGTKDMGIKANPMFIVTSSDVFTKSGKVAYSVKLSANNAELAKGEINVVPAVPMNVRINLLDAARSIIAGEATEIRGRLVDAYDNIVPGPAHAFWYRVDASGMTVTGSKSGQSYDWPIVVDKIVFPKVGKVFVAITIDGIDGKAIYNVVPGALAKVEITAPSEVQKGQSFNVSVFGYDTEGNKRNNDEVEVNWASEWSKGFSKGPFGTLMTLSASGMGDLEITAKSGKVESKAVVKVVEAPKAPATATTASTAASASAKNTYKVQKGDTLWSVFINSGSTLSWNEWLSTVMKTNNLSFTAGTNVVNIAIGGTIVLP